MSKPVLYTQCSLSRTLPDGGIASQVAWIPKRFAKLKGFVRLGDDNWEVVGVGATMGAEAVADAARAHTKQREASDI